MPSRNKRREYSAFLYLLTIICALHRVTSKVCTGNQPLVSGLHFSVLDYQMWSNSNDTTTYPGTAFGENSENEMLISYEGRIGADHYRGWCSAANPVEQPFLQVDFKREVMIEQVETQGLLLNHGEAAARYITGFWLAYATNTAMSFINVTKSNSNVTKIFSGQNESNYTASVLQYLPQPITVRIVRLYPTDSVPSTMACVKLELHGCVPQREEECQSVYPLSCCSYGTPGDIINSVEVTSDNPDDSVPGPVANILSFYDDEKFWCGQREEYLLPINATFHFTEEVLLTSVAFHGLDGENADDYVTQYSWEYSVGNSTVETYADLGNNTILKNTREDKFQQTFWAPIRVQTLKFIVLEREIRPCIAFKFFGCKINEVISVSQMSTTEMISLAPTSTSVQQVSTSTTYTPASSTSTSTTLLDKSIIPQCTSILSSNNCSAVTMTTTVASITSTIMITPSSSSSSSSSQEESPTPSPQESVGHCVGDEDPLISGTRYYINDNQLSASGHDPLHYTYSNMNERVLLVPQEGRIGNMYSSFLGWCSQKVTNIVNNAPYIQVDFSTPVVVSSVAIQGFEINGDSRQCRYVREFQLVYRDLESKQFCTINNNSQPVNFTGNTGTNYLDPFKSSLPKPIRAKAFRLYPKSWKSEAVVNDNVMDTNRACLKWELYGCISQDTAQGSCYPNQISLSSSDVNITSNAANAIATSSLLRFPDDSDNWCPSTKGIDLPLVINFSFSEEILMTSLAITGRETNDADYFVSSYSLSYASNESCDPTLYKDLLGQSVFYNDHVRTFFHSFWEPIPVRRLQLLITDWHITPCISIGFFGCSRSEVNVNVTTSSGMGNTPSQDVCIAPTNNVLLSCVNVASSNYVDADDNSVVTVAIVLPVCLAIVLLVILVVILYRRLRIKLKSTRLSYLVNNPVFMQSDNPIYERNQNAIKLLDDDDQSQHYSKLQHHKDDGAFSSNLYSALQQQSTQNYAQAGPRESASSVTYEEMPYYEIVTSKPD